MEYVAIIPARYASTRFPGKPLALLGGKMVIERVYRRAQEALGDGNVAVATDDERIVKAVESFGGQAVMTSASHRSGTDRCYEAYQTLGSKADIVVNIQGDEPFISPDQIRSLMACFDDPTVDIATLVRPLAPTTSFEELNNPNRPKVVTACNGDALYFSRSIIPYLRGIEKEEWTSRHRYLHHVGMYAFRSTTLGHIVTLPPSPLEVAESLEQLRWLQNGCRIRTAETDIETIGIDTPADLEAAELFLNSNKLNR